MIIIAKKIKLIAIDLGGTLLSDDNMISKENIEAINFAKSKGIKIAIATARMYSSTKYISNVIDADYGIFSNGSYVLDIKNMKAIKKSAISKKAVEDIVSFSKKNNLYLHLNEEYKEGSDKMEYFTLKHTLLNKNYPKELKSNVFLVNDIQEYIKKSQDILKLIIVSDNNLDSIQRKITPILDANKLYITEFYKNLNEKAINKVINYIEIGNSKDTKYSGLKALLKKISIKEKQILFIGDGDNDSDMFEYVDNSCCMSNGNEKIKMLANYTTNKDNNHSGVSEAIYKFIK